MTADVQPGPVPETFAALRNIAPEARCGHCGKPATHRISVNVLPGTEGKTSPIRSLRSKLVCEKCAVALFITVARALRAL